MALSNLAQRILSSLVLFPLLVLMVWLGGAWVVGAAAVCALLSLFELYQLFAHTGYTPRPVGYICALLFILAAAANPSVSGELVGLVLIVTLVATLGLELVRRDRNGMLVAWSLTFSGAVYIGWTFAHFVLLRSISTRLRPAPINIPRLTSGPAWILFALLITFASDTAAYFVGRAWGRRRMAPTISPSKTWEGSIGGVVAAVLAGALLVYLLGLPIDVRYGALLGGVGSVAGQAGDLAESLLKRQVGIKDSGRLIPGHGGILDRADSLLFTVPAIYYLVRWLTV